MNYLAVIQKNRWYFRKLKTYNYYVYSIYYTISSDNII